MKHKIKIEQPYLIHLLEGTKNFEIRKNDRDYQVDDQIEFLPLSSDHYNVYEHCGYLPKFKITYVHHGPGMEEGYVALAISPERK